MPVPPVAANDPAMSAWANAVHSAVTELEGDLYPTLYGQLALPWAALTGKPATFPPDVTAAVSPSTAYGQAPAAGVSAAAARADHVHGSVALPTPAQVGTLAAYNSPNTPAGGKRIFVGTAVPVGAVEGDIWIKG